MNVHLQIAGLEYQETRDPSIAQNVAEKRGRKMNKKMLDLFSGLGGASESFLNNGWEVMRIEKNPALALVPNTKILDVYDLGQYLDIMEGKHPDGQNLSKEEKKKMFKLADRMLVQFSKSPNSWQIFLEVH